MYKFNDIISLVHGHLMKILKRHKRILGHFHFMGIVVLIGVSQWGIQSDMSNIYTEQKLNYQSQEANKD